MTPGHILETVAKQYGVAVSDITGKSRALAATEPRRMCALMMRKHTQLSFESIGDVLGLRDHTTIMYLVRTAEEKLASEVAYVRQVEGVEHALAPRVSRIRESMVQCAYDSLDIIPNIVDAIDRLDDRTMIAVLFRVSVATESGGAAHDVARCKLAYVPRQNELLFRFASVDARVFDVQLTPGEDELQDVVVEIGEYSQLDGGSVRPWFTVTDDEREELLAKVLAWSGGEKA